MRMLGIGLGAVAALAAVAGAALAQVPPDIAAGLKEIGPKIEVAKTAALYAPLIAKEPYDGVTVTREVAYGPDPKNTLDIFTATNPGRGKPVLIFVSGGGFVSNSKVLPGTPFYNNVGLWAVKNGMVGINMTYRTAPKNKWPSGIEDVRAAVVWAKANAAKYGGDPNRIFLWGHSAGAAHVADYTAHPEIYGAKTPEVAGSIMSSGTYVVTPTPNPSPYYGAGTADELMAKSSLPGLVKGKTPIFINYAELDPDMFHTQADALNKALCEAGHCPTYVRALKDASHISSTFAVGTPDTELSGPVLTFIRSVK